MKRPTLRIGAGILLSVILALPVLLVPVTAMAADIRISAVNFDFQPENRSVKPGDRIKWGNDGQNSHTVTFTSGPQIDVQIAPGDESQFFTFNQQGTFSYYCRFHGTPGGTGMAGTVTVTSGSTSSPSPSPTATGTITITVSPSPSPTPTRRTSSPTPTRTTASPTPSPSPTTPTPTPTTPTPTPTPTQPTDSASPIPSITGDETGSTGSGNTQAIIAIVGVLVLGALGFLVYRRTLSAP